MDFSQLCMDDQRQSPTPPTASQKLNDSSKGMEFNEETTETLSNISKSLPQEKNSDSDSRADLEGFLSCAEHAQKDDNIRVSNHFGLQKPGLPLLSTLSHDPISPLTDSFPDIRQEPSLSLSAQTFDGSMKPSLPESLSTSRFSPECTKATCQSRSLSHRSDSLEGDIAKAQVSELYIFESETLDFILSSNVDPQEIKCPELKPLSETEGTQADPNCDINAQMNDSENLVTQCHHGSGEEQAIADCESHVRYHTRLVSPAVDACEAGLMSGNDAGERAAEVADSTPQTSQSDSPIELWQDACQYLTHEDTEDQDVLDKTSLSVMQGVRSDWYFPQGETQGSGCFFDGSEWIGWSGDDTKGWGPPVERWSSVDSWASALSDWTEIIAAPPEDFTAAFTEIGAEIDALTQALAEVNTQIDTETSRGRQDQEIAAQAQSQLPMGVQDQPQNIPEGSILSGQGCLFFNLDSAENELREREVYQRVESLCDSGEAIPVQNVSEEIQSSLAESAQSPSQQEMTMGSSVAALPSTGGYDLGVTSGSTSSTHQYVCPFCGFGESAETDSSISNEEDSVILNIIEETDSAGRDAPAEFIMNEPFGGELCEVTDECIVPQPVSIDKQEAKRSLRPAEVDHEGTQCTTDLYFLATHTSTDWHVPGGDIKPGLHINVPAHVSTDTSPDFDGASQLESQGGSPKFIMPLAPLNISSSLVCRTRSLDSDQTCSKSNLNDNRDLSCGYIQPCALWPTLDGITGEQSFKGDEDLVIKKENTVEPSETSSKDNQLDSNIECFFTTRKTINEDISYLSRELSNLAVIPEDNFIISEENRVAYVTLDVNDPFAPRVPKPINTEVKSREAEVNPKTAEKMPHKTHKSSSEGKSRPKKDKSAGHHHGTQTSKKQENLSHHVPAQQVCKQQELHPLSGENHTSENTPAVLEDKEAKLMIETCVANEKAPCKHSKKKKKHTQNVTGAKSVGEPLVEVENGAQPKTAKGKIDMFEAKLDAKTQKDSNKASSAEKIFQESEAQAFQEEQKPHHTDQAKKSASPPKDDIIKKRRLLADKFGKIVSALESKLPKPDVSVKAKGEQAKVDAGATRKKAYSDVVKQSITSTEEIKVVKTIQPESVSGDPQSMCLWCQFSAVFFNHTVTWSRDGTVLAEIKRSAGDESRVSLTISNASHKDLGKYQCRLTSSHGSVALDYLLTYEVLSEIVIPAAPKIVPSTPVEVGGEEEDVNCSRLLFKEDFLSEQYFGENQPASIITEKVHFGEGMHRRAFRTKLQAGQIPLLVPGHPCVLKVHNAISYGTKNNDELVQKNFSLAVEECQVQNTAREYIKAYTTAAQSFEAFGEIPEIIPIYLVHRPSNDIPYATLEEELIGDFVKYSVKDGKEINLMRRDSEAGQKCCAFQHWVYQKTDGNLLVTDMQGVGMRLTDVGIATCKKGYKGFKGNCATSFIDQFKVLHQCNRYCEILGLKSLQPKPKKAAAAPKPKPQPATAPKKKTFGPTVKSKS
ncbi:alpha-protein kinase 2 isoform X2 [Cheilinus undulatus]|uniref:alpha-protein kinase 2 isoform X2 n=1 Tax=Cheilinus undulatus TaxID=241271 RepID=UPI001BD425E1|nr:alpha-protein kinase 2 isoform X2 [Cheilinus undulatus]